MIRSAVAAYFDRLNGEDWDGLVELFSDDARLRAPGTAPRRGRDAIGAYFKAALAPYAEHLDDPVRVVVGGATATVDIVFTGRLANGRMLEFEAVDVFDVVNDKIEALSSWYDSHAVRRALLEAQAAEGPPPVEGAQPLGSVAEATPARLRAALALVRRGVTFRLDLPLDRPELPLFGREPLRHTVFALPDWPRTRDDVLDNFNTQVSSHWDALRHWLGPEGECYGGRSSEQTGIDVWAGGICARAVLVDLRGGLGLAWNERRVVTPAEIERCAACQGVELRPGDALLLYTGWVAEFLRLPVESRPAEIVAPGIGADDETIGWLRERRLAAVAADNPGLEVVPPTAGEETLHGRVLPGLGLALGELWWLEGLREDCAADGVWEGVLVSVPLNLPGGCASPANAIVIK